MTRGKQWKAEELPLEDVRQHPDFQRRVGGLELTQVNKLVRALHDGEEMAPVEVARIGEAYYLIDGHHRHEAHRRAGCKAIAAKVAKMSLTGAKAAAELANTRNGRGLSRADKQARWDRYIAKGDHLDAEGNLKKPSAIEQELGRIYHHQSIWRKLKDLGYERDEERWYPDGYKPYSGGDDEVDEVELAVGRFYEAKGHLRGLVSLYSTLDEEAQGKLLGAARDVVAGLERGERVELEPDEEYGSLDI